MKTTFKPGDQVVSLLGTPGVVVGHTASREGHHLIQVKVADGRVCNYPPMLLQPKEKP